MTAPLDLLWEQYRSLGAAQPADFEAFLVAEVERLTAERDEARGALAPFAAVYSDRMARQLGGYVLVVEDSYGIGEEAKVLRGEHFQAAHLVAHPGEGEVTT